MLTNNAFMHAAPLDPQDPRKFLARDPRLNPNDPLAGATLHWPPGLPGYERITRSYFAAAYELNHKLNDLLFDSLDIDANERARLGSVPFCVLKQLRYGPGKDALNAYASTALRKVPRPSSSPAKVRLNYHRVTPPGQFAPSSSPHRHINHRRRRPRHPHRCRLHHR